MTENSILVKVLDNHILLVPVSRYNEIKENIYDKQ